ncbi:response regulator [Mesorhizobium sp. M1066]|uniref:response regulator n=1 Tax=unclassified Mesorhizobium TaxID=325217 RepID=UPI003337F469
MGRSAGNGHDPGREVPALKGLRVLVVEDESLVAMLIEDVLADLGCALAGMASRVDDAMDKVATLEFDAVILDVNLDGADTYPVADALTERSIPFIFATGYGAGGIPQSFRNVPVLGKPFEQGDLERALRAGLVSRTDGAPG